MQSRHYEGFEIDGAYAAASRSLRDALAMLERMEPGTIERRWNAEAMQHVRDALAAIRDAHDAHQHRL